MNCPYSIRWRRSKEMVGLFPPPSTSLIFSINYIGSFIDRKLEIRIVDIYASQQFYQSISITQIDAT
jgi:hypothetical protein